MLAVLSAQNATLHLGDGRKLIDGIRNQSIVKKPKNTSEQFKIKPAGIKEAIKKALDTEDKHYFDSHWVDAISSSGLHPHWWEGLTFGNRIVNINTIKIKKTNPKTAFKPIQEIGGKNGWYFCNFSLYNLSKSRLILVNARFFDFK